MTPKSPTNLPASVRHRLLNIAKNRGQELQTILAQFGTERLLYRLGQSAAKDRLVLKGAVLFYAWEGGLRRPTRDVDFLGFGDASPEAVAEIFRMLCRIEVEPDGLIFREETLQADAIRDTHNYGGVRVTLMATLGTARIPLQIDVGFGDAVTPAAETTNFPTLLDFPAPTIRAYPPETVIAEKFEAMVAFGIVNTRMKDFYDLYTLSQERVFDGATIARAIAAPFLRRTTPLPDEMPIALTRDFGDDPAKQAQWSAFLKRSRLTNVPPDLGAIVDHLRDFLWGPAEAARDSDEFHRAWLPGIGWNIDNG